MIRLAKLTDYEAIKSFDQFSAIKKEDILEQRVFVYIHNKLVCAYISLARDGLLGRPYIQYLMVKPTDQRKGIASKLLSFIKEKYSEKKLFISTESNNESMKKLLLKLQYIPAGEIAGANLNGTTELYFFK